MRRHLYARSSLLAAASIFSVSTWAATYDVTINGSDAIFLAGRTDLTIPDASLPWDTGTHLIRHPGPTPEEIKETLPPGLAVTAGDVVRVLDPAVGGSASSTASAHRCSVRPETVRAAAFSPHWTASAVTSGRKARCPVYSSPMRFPMGLRLRPPSNSPPAAWAQVRRVYLRDWARSSISVTA